MPVKIYRQGLLKKADESLTFEQQLGTMTNARVSEKIPLLNPYAIGFELIKKDEDGTKGCGTMVYLIGDQTVYVPSFFNQGRLRTADIIILADKQQFLPATEGVVTYLKSKYDRSVGETVEKNQPKIVNGMPSSVTVRDNLTPIRKAASFLLDMDKIEEHANTPLNILDVALKMGKEASLSLVNIMSNDTRVFNDFVDFYGVDALGHFKTAAEKLCTPVYESPDTYLVEPFSKQASGMTEKEQELMETFGFLVKTARNDFSKVERESDVVEAFTTVTDTGMYDVMTVGGELVKAFVARVDSEGCGYCTDMAYMRTTKGPNTVYSSFLHPSEGTMSQTFRYIYMLEDTPNGVYLKHEGPLTGRKYNTDRNEVLKAIQEKAKKLKAGENIPHSSVILCPDGTAVQVNSEYIPVSGGGWMSKWGDGFISVSSSVIHPYFSNTRLILPEGCVFFISIDSWLNSESKSEDKEESFRKYSVKLVGEPDFNTILDKYMGDKYTRVKIYSNGSGFVLSDDSKSVKPEELSIKEASFRLVRDYNVDPSEAPHMVLEAYPKDHVSNSYARFCIEKKAAGGDYSRGASPYDIPHNISYHEVEYDGPQVERVATDGLIPSPGMTPQQLQEIVHRAAEKGIKEVFDVTIMKSLVETSRPDVLLGDYYTTMVKMLDKLSRMLFLAYAKEDDFKSQFGDDKYAEFVETLKNSMNDLAELFIFIRSRGVAVDGMELSGNDNLLEGSVNA